MTHIQQKATMWLRTLSVAMTLVASMALVSAADQTPPPTYHVDIWPKLTALAQHAQQQGAIPADETGKPITELKTLISRYQGRYASPTGIYKVFEHGGQLRIKREGDLSKLLRLQENGQFAPWRLMRGHIPVQYNETKKVRYAFVTLDGREVLIVHENGVLRWAGEKVNKTDISEAWKQRTGRYLLTGLPPDYQLKADIAIHEEFGLLWLSGRLTSEENIIAPLLPGTETEYRIGGFGHWAGESLHVTVTDGQEGLTLSGNKLQRK
jgi:hypothetical protein